MPQALLIPNGTYGDVHPYLTIGAELVRRDWDVKIYSMEPFRAESEQLGMEFDLRDDDKDFLARIVGPKNKSARQVRRHKMGRLKLRIERTLEYLRCNTQPGDVVLAPFWEMGARVARDKMPIKHVSVHLQPMAMMSAADCPVFPSWAPALLKQMLFYGINKSIDSWFKQTINTHREEQGLSRIRRVSNWWHSPDLVLAMFPEWFGPPQVDWPDNVTQPGFPLYQSGEQSPPDEPLDRFLDSRVPTVVFARSTALAREPHFYQAAIESAARLGCQALLLTADRDQLPEQLPEGVMWRSYLSYREVLPRCDTFVHNGGVGAVAEGLLAGTPQLIVDICNDQADNALRLERLGVGKRLPKRGLSTDRLSQLLVELQAPDIREACGQFASQMSSRNAAGLAADAIENLISGDQEDHPEPVSKPIGSESLRGTVDAGAAML